MLVRTGSFQPRTKRSRFSTYFVLPLALALTGVSACGDDPVEHEEEPIGTIRLTVGSQTINVTGAGTAPSITISGASTAVSATFLAEDGDALTLDPAEFEIRVTSQNSGIVTYTRTGSFTGTLNRVSAGTTTIGIEVYHLVAAHGEFGPHSVSVTVQ